jgi:allantoin racemase
MTAPEPSTMEQKPIHIRVVTPITAQDFREDGVMSAFNFPGIEISQTQIETGPGSVESEFEVALAIPGILARVAEAGRDGVDAIVIDCMADPGVRASREITSIPVLGPCQTSMHVAAMLGHRFSVLSVAERVRPMYENCAATSGLTSKFASMRSIDVPVLELEKDMAVTVARLIEQALLAVQVDHADALIFGCTGLLGCADSVRQGLLERGIDIPVIDPVPTTIAMAASIARLGLAQSPLTYGMPPVKDLVGYDALHVSKLGTAAKA